MRQCVLKTMEIKVKTQTGMKYAVDIDEITTIADVKSTIFVKKGIPAQQRYIHCGKLLNDEQTVMNLLKENARHLTEAIVLNMILSLRGG